LHHFLVLNPNYKFIMNKLSLLFVASAFCVVSCEYTTDVVSGYEPVEDQDETLTNDEVEALANFFSNPKVSQDEAVESALSIMDFLDSSSQTKGSSGRKIESVKPVMGTNFLTKSGEEVEDTVAYVFNFSDNQGYTILSADRRTSGVLALVPEGNIDFEGDFDEDILKSGAMVFYGNLAAAYEDEIAEAEQKEAMLVSSALEKLFGSDSTLTKGELDDVTVEYGPLKIETLVCNMIAVRWGQDNPYNLYTPVISGEHAPTGCVATAVAQLLSYWKTPRSYDWKTLVPFPGCETEHTFFGVSQLMSEVADGLNTKYGKKESSANIADVPAYLTSLGLYPGTYAAFGDGGEVGNSLADYHPVIMAGSAIKCDVYKQYLIFFEKYSHTYYDDNHAWVVDGVVMSYRDMYMTYQGKTYTFDHQMQKMLLHCNWGWPHLPLDGFYEWGVFDTRKGPLTRARTNQNGSKGYYRYNVEAISGIERR